MTRALTWTALALLILVSATPADAALPPKTEVAGETLILNGVGKRQATFLKLDVYEAALYLEKKTTDARQVLESDRPKYVHMTFLRNLSADQIRESWVDGFKENCGNHCEEFRPALNHLNARIRDAKKGDRLEFDFLPTKTRLIANGETLATLPGGGFGKILLAIWLGDEPADEKLKKGMLGQRSG